MKAQLLIPAGGFGIRLGKGVPKALVPIEGKPILYWTIKRLSKIQWNGPIIAVIPQGYRDYITCEVLKKYNLPDCILVEGGHERQFSVFNGLQHVEHSTEIVVIHDCARPFVPIHCVIDSIQKAQKVGAVTVALPVVNTILEVSDDLLLINTPNRKYLYECQTPQTFKKELILQAHQEARLKGLLYSDDATLVREMGHPVAIVLGDPMNIKITLPFDIKVSEYLMKTIENNDE